MTGERFNHNICCFPLPHPVSIPSKLRTLVGYPDANGGEGDGKDLDGIVPCDLHAEECDLQLLYSENTSIHDVLSVCDRVIAGGSHHDTSIQGMTHSFVQSSPLDCFQFSILHKLGVFNQNESTTPASLGMFVFQFIKFIFFKNYTTSRKISMIYNSWEQLEGAIWGASPSANALMESRSSYDARQLNLGTPSLSYASSSIPSANPTKTCMNMLQARTHVPRPTATNPTLETVNNSLFVSCASMSSFPSLEAHNDHTESSVIRRQRGDTSPTVSLTGSSTAGECGIALLDWDYEDIPVVYPVYEADTVGSAQRLSCSSGSRDPSFSNSAIAPDARQDLTRAAPTSLHTPDVSRDCRRVANSEGMGCTILSGYETDDDLLFNNEVPKGTHMLRNPPSVDLDPPLGCSLNHALKYSSYRLLRFFARLSLLR